jgi:hypothetical protein
MSDEPVIYRLEVLTIMTLIGDIGFAMDRLIQRLEGDDGEEEEDRED